jgi:hypothetical protein
VIDEIVGVVFVENQKPDAFRIRDMVFEVLSAPSGMPVCTGDVLTLTEMAEWCEINAHELRTWSLMAERFWSEDGFEFAVVRQPGDPFMIEG